VDGKLYGKLHWNPCKAMPPNLHSFMSLIPIIPIIQLYKTCIIHIIRYKILPAARCIIHTIPTLHTIRQSRAAAPYYTEPILINTQHYLQEQREFMRDKLAQPPSQPDIYYHHTPVKPPQPQPQPQPNLTPYDPRSTPAYLAQLEYTQAKLNTLEQDSSHEQRAFNAKYEAKEQARRARKQRDEQRGCDEEKPRERIEPTEEVRGVRGIGLGGDQDETRWVPTYPISQPPLATQAYEMAYEPPQAAASFGSRPIDRGDMLGPTTQYQLPTPIPHLELKQDTYKGYRTAYNPYPAATPYDDDDVVSNCGDTPPSGYHPQPPTPTLDARPPLQPLDYDEYDPTGDHGPYATSFEYHKRKGNTAPMEPDCNITIEQLALELFASGNPGVNWAEEMDHMGLQGEYYHPPTNYSAPPPAPHCPTPWVPPPPPTPAYRPPKAQFPPHRGWYNPSRTQDQPRHAPYHPRTRCEVSLTRNRGKPKQRGGRMQIYC
jgi:hypothetical protein